MKGFLGFLDLVSVLFSKQHLNILNTFKDIVSTNRYICLDIYIHIF